MQREHAEREQALSQQLQALRQEFQCKEEVWTDAHLQLNEQLRVEREATQNLQKARDALQDEVTTMCSAFLGGTWHLFGQLRAGLGHGATKPATQPAPLKNRMSRPCRMRNHASKDRVHRCNKHLQCKLPELPHKQKNDRTFGSGRTHPWLLES